MEGFLGYQVCSLTCDKSSNIGTRYTSTPTLIPFSPVEGFLGYRVCSLTCDKSSNIRTRYTSTPTLILFSLVEGLLGYRVFSLTCDKSSSVGTRYASTPTFSIGRVLWQSRSSPIVSTTAKLSSNAVKCECALTLHQ